MPTVNIGELVTLGIRNRSRKLADNVTKNNAILAKLSMKGKIKTEDGGTSILQELEYDENATYKRYTGYELLDISPSEVFDAAEFSRKQIAVAVLISGAEMMANAGRSKTIDLVESRINNAEKTMRNGVSLDLYSDGTADSGKQIGGLASLVPAAPGTGTVGGINRATYSWWRNYFTTGETQTKDAITPVFNEAYASLCRGTDKPDLILVDNHVWNTYMESLQDRQRFATTEGAMANLGFTSVKYMQSDVVLDGGVGGGMPANTAKFLNTDYIHFRPHADRNFVALSPDRFATNQDAHVKLIGWAGNATLSNAMLQGHVGFNARP